MTSIGILSDTHGFLDERIFTHFAVCDEIWHAGDIGSLEVLNALRTFKPTRAVYGNVDGGDVRYTLQEFYRFRIEDVEILLTHIGGYPKHYNPLVIKHLQQRTPNLFVCGHSHILKVQYDHDWQMLTVNPGACGHQGWQTVRTIMRLKIDSDAVKDLEVIELK